MELSKPLTLEEVQEAADIFLPLYQEVRVRLCAINEKPSVEDTLKVMDNICKLAQQQRAQTKLDRFGFNKEKENGDVPSS
jgi:hypothetical protein